MHGVTTAGPYFVTAAVAQGSRLIRNNRKRMATRRRKSKSRGAKRSSRRR